MKRAGNLMQQIVLSDNLMYAYLDAAKGKRERLEVKMFTEKLQRNINDLGRDMWEGTYQFGGYNRFVIYEPKKREISAAHFRDRVAMQAIMRVCLPVFERHQMDCSCACRIGKGQFKAIERAQMLARKYKWFVKLDVCKFFDSINHDVLYSLLQRQFKDRKLLECFRMIIDSHNITSGVGLPIGNLTSQHFANHYLSIADHYLHEHLHVRAMVRYMDDMILFDNDLDRLKDISVSFTQYLKDILKLELHIPIYNNVCFGIPFLGHVVFPYKLHLNTASRKRFRAKIYDDRVMYTNKEISESDYRNRLSSLYAFTQRAGAVSFHREVMHQQGMLP